MNKEFIIMIIFASLFVGIILVLVFSKLLKRTTIIPYHDDELIKENIGKNDESYLFYTSGETRKYIVKYVLNSTDNNKFVICNYKDEYKRIGFFVECFDKKKKLIKSYCYRDLNPAKNSSRIIPVDKRTSHVNIVISYVNEEVLNNDVFYTIGKMRKVLFSSLVGLAAFSFMMVIRYFSFTFVNKDYAVSLFNSYLSWFAVLVALLIGIFAAIFASISINKRDAKNKVGGVIDYDFNR